mgnify:FL=1
MPQSRIPYFCEGLFVGPSPSSGYHFIHYTGSLNNDYTNFIQNHNLLLPINRVQNVSFSFSPSRTDIKQIGKRALVSYPNVNSPNIRLDFEYLLNGLANDARIGLNVNYAQYQHPFTGGTAKYASNFEVNLLSGLMGRQLTQPTEDPFFPAAIRDNRNIFLVRSNETDQLFKRDKEKITEVDYTRNGADPQSTGYQIFALGNCYLESYKTQAAVNSFPVSNVSWSCENVAFYLSGSGCNIPAINTQTRQIVNSNKFVVPITDNEGGPYILHPGDLILDIISSGNSLSGLGVDFNNIHITNYQIDMNFNREPLGSLGYKCPIDRQVNFPVFVDLSFGMTVGDTTSGTLIDLLNVDSGYNITIRLRNPLDCSPFITTTGNPRQSGPVFSGQGHTAIRYDFRDAKFIGSNFNTAIGMNKTANLSFRGEIDPDVVNKGFYISGLLNIECLEDTLVDEDGFAIVDEDMGAIVGNLRPLY